MDVPFLLSEAQMRIEPFFPLCEGRPFLFHQARTAHQLIASMPELGSLENKKAAALAGLTPVARQSGQWKGKSFTRGGRANVRPFTCQLSSPLASIPT